MKRFSSRLLVLCLGALLCGSVSGCGSKQSANFDLESGNTVIVEYDAIDGLNLFYEESVFYIGNKSEVPKINGYFAAESTFDYYSVAVEKEETATLLGYSNVPNKEFLTYSISGVGDKLEYVHLYHVEGTDLYVALISFESEDFILKQKDCLDFVVK